MSKSVVGVWIFTCVGVSIHLWMLISPPESGNGLTTLPFVLFLLAAVGSSSLAVMGGRMGRAGTALKKHRRSLGINAAIWGLTHAVTKGALSLAVQPEGLTTHLFRPEILAAMMGLAILVSMLVTSNDVSMRFLKSTWKQLHRLAWLVPGIALVHGHRASENFTVEGEMNLPVLVPLLILVGLPVVAWFKTRRKTEGQKVFWVLAGFLIPLTVVIFGGTTEPAAIRQS